MRSLVIDTATEACSCAVFDTGQLVAGDYVKLGRGHAERLVPMLSMLPERGRANEIIVNCGPGSFTGLRVGLSAAKALGLAWNVPVYGYNSLSLVAAMALTAKKRAEGVDIAMYGGHGEYFVQSFDLHGNASNEMQSLKPDKAALNLKTGHIAGSSAKLIADIMGNTTSLVLWPDARSAFLLSKQQRTLPAEPVYGRQPDARPMTVHPVQVKE